ncbi:hypothetical protein [Mangrovicoccus algicola]|uniref:Uncharacterized protein n=1 Tax=Mangrovicoccus algicola TaxID=2771008 RepID=A0A8J7CZ48_9RHOB|nr:hypothetical protein [Mangrovicoccus algicola]MBE3637363.1 hypothetical protein [Mangrovicoccus algicola]
MSEKITSLRDYLPVIAAVVAMASAFAVADRRGEANSVRINDIEARVRVLEARSIRLDERLQTILDVQIEIREQIKDLQR